MLHGHSRSPPKVPRAEWLQKAKTNTVSRAWGVSEVHAAGPQIKAFHPYRQCLTLGRPVLGTLIYCEEVFNPSPMVHQSLSTVNTFSLRLFHKDIED